MMGGLVGSIDTKAQMWPWGGSHPGSRPAKPSTGPRGKEAGCQLEGRQAGMSMVRVTPERGPPEWRAEVPGPWEMLRWH